MPMKILFIEDNPEFSKYLSILLESYGHNVELCDNADQAVGMLDRLCEFNLVVLDLMMILGSIIRPDEGKETGIALYKRIRKLNMKIAILVLTAQDKADIWEDFKTDPKVAYHHKPPNIPRLLTQIEELT
jgi:CheY-like chemotaxis protein